MTEQKRHDDQQHPRKSPRDTGTSQQAGHEPEPLDDRFEKERQDRDRSAVESQNQGQGPLNVGDQSRTR